MAFHVDGVAIGRASAQLSAFYDLERIEVLRGPQGTLYGRNATAGSVNLITREPTGQLEAYLNSTLGSYGLVQFAGAVSGPVDGAGKLQARLAFQSIDRGGYGRNVTLGRDINDQHAQSLRASLKYDGEGFDVKLVGDYSVENDRNYTGSNFGPYIPGTKLLGEDARRAEHPQQPRHRVGDRSDQPAAQLGPERHDRVDISDTVKLQSITGYRNFKRRNINDLENTSVPIVYYDTSETSEQFSQGSAIALHLGQPPGIVGAYYYHENLQGTSTVALPYFGNTFRFPQPRSAEWPMPASLRRPCSASSPGKPSPI